MHNYANSFKCASDGESEVVITFMQEIPEIKEDGSIENVVHENVSSLVMRADVAHALGEALLNLTSPKEQ